MDNNQTPPAEGVPLNPLDSIVEALCPSMFKLPRAIAVHNKNGRYDELIERCKKGYFHHWKHDLLPGGDEYSCPKVELMKEIQKHPPLWVLKDPLLLGMFDDKMDQSDMARMKANLEFDGLATPELLMMMKLM